MTEWKLADAKNRFSELLDMALGEGPQRISRRKDTVVVLSLPDYEKLVKKHLRSRIFFCVDLLWKVSILSATRPPLETFVCENSSGHMRHIGAATQNENQANQKAVTEIASGDLFLSALTIGELAKGIALLHAGKKRQYLTIWLSHLQSEFADRIMIVDAETTTIWGELTTQARHLITNQTDFRRLAICQNTPCRFC